MKKQEKILTSMENNVEIQEKIKNDIINIRNINTIASRARKIFYEDIVESKKKLDQANELLNSRPHFTEDDLILSLIARNNLSHKFSDLKKFYKWVFSDLLVDVMLETDHLRLSERCSIACAYSNGYDKELMVFATDVKIKSFQTLDVLLTRKKLTSGQVQLVGMLLDEFEIFTEENIHFILNFFSFVCISHNWSIEVLVQKDFLKKINSRYSKIGLQVSSENYERYIK